MAQSPEKGVLDPARALRRVARPLWRDAQEAVLKELEGVTMQDLCQDAERLGVERGGDSPADFNI